MGVQWCRGCRGWAEAPRSSEFPEEGAQVSSHPSGRTVSLEPRQGEDQGGGQSSTEGPNRPQPLSLSGGNPEADVGCVTHSGCSSGSASSRFSAATARPRISDLSRLWPAALGDTWLKWTLGPTRGRWGPGGARTFTLGSVSPIRQGRFFPLRGSVLGAARGSVASCAVCSTALYFHGS